jgi:hypothetical protein
LPLSLLSACLPAGRSLKFKDYNAKLKVVQELRKKNIYEDLSQSLFELLPRPSFAKAMDGMFSPRLEFLHCRMNRIVTESFKERKNQ